MPLTIEIGGRKFRLARHRKNEEVKNAPSMLVSVPRDAITVSVGSMTIQSSITDLHPAVQCEETGPMHACIFPDICFHAERNHNC